MMKKALLSALAAVSLLGSLFTASAQADRLSYHPLPVSIEGRKTPSGLHIGMQEEPLERAVPALAEGAAAGSAQEALGKFIGAIAKNDPEAFAAICDYGGKASRAVNDLAMYRAFITDPAKVQVLRSFRIGGGTLFSMKALDRPASPVFVFLFTQKEGRQVCDVAGFEHPVVQNAATLAREIESDPKAYASTQQPPDAPHELKFDDLFGDAGRHPVVFRFQGFPLKGKPEEGTDQRARALEGLPADYASAVKLCDEAIGSLESGDIEGAKNRLGGEASRRWFEKTSAVPARLKNFIGVHGRPVRYILGSPTYKILIFENKKGEVLPISTFEQVVTPADGKPGIVNLGEVSTINYLMQWQPFGEALFKDDIQSSKSK